MRNLCVVTLASRADEPKRNQQQQPIPVWVYPILIFANRGTRAEMETCVVIDVVLWARSCVLWLLSRGGGRRGFRESRPREANFRRTRFQIMSTQTSPGIHVSGSPVCWCRGAREQADNVHIMLCLTCFSAIFGSQSTQIGMATGRQREGNVAPTSRDKQSSGKIPSQFVMFLYSAVYRELVTFLKPRIVFWEHVAWSRRPAVGMSVG
ncbi:hypothetical protein BKA61DRAFT_577052 [Leptodontidium sp. MPI-SDFR-AT-0119]|nr:hypothetical protein BKA61DRAFT_577052 [Leptodontidium sp. MPI-SDFR-AT-0119]